jgi:hypothetical protein
MKYKPLIILLFFGYTLKINLAISNSYFSFSLLTFENLQNHFIVQFFNFSFWRNFANKKKAAYQEEQRSRLAVLSCGALLVFSASLSLSRLLVSLACVVRSLLLRAEPSGGARASKGRRIGAGFQSFFSCFV